MSATLSPVAATPPSPSSPSSVASITPTKHRKILDTPDIWLAMSVVASSPRDAAPAASQDVGVVAWDRMDTLMRSFEYGGTRCH